jgi:hypothetical protein
MPWIRQGLIFAADQRYPWMASHAQCPVADPTGDGRLRIYFATRDSQNRSVATYIEVASADPGNVIYVHDRPVLGLGALGCFDDSGVIPSWIVSHAGLKYLYYIGINVGTTVPYRNAIGLAVSSDGGESFSRMYSGPVLDRFASEPHLCTTPCVLVENGKWKMWYGAGTEWRVMENKAEPFYNIRYTESSDGVIWQRPGRLAIDLNPQQGGIGRPSVVREKDRYRMWFSARGASDYRTNKAHSYRIGYAESADGETWSRKDELAGIGLADEGWDSEMLAYPYVYQWRESLYMVYNGNGFGRSGFGYAIANHPQGT